MESNEQVQLLDRGHRALTSDTVVDYLETRRGAFVTVDSVVAAARAYA